MIKNITNSDKTTNKGGIGSRGARVRVFFCAGVDEEDNLLAEAVSALTEDEAINSFIQKHDLEPTICLKGEGNGYYIAKGTGISEVHRMSVTVSVEQLVKRTTSTFKGQFKGWNVFASGLKACQVDKHDFSDNELLSVEFESRIDEDSKVVKPKLKKREVVRRNDIENLVEFS